MSGNVGLGTAFLTGLDGGYFLNTYPVPSPAPAPLVLLVSRKKLDFNIFLFFTLSRGSLAEVGLLLDPKLTKCDLENRLSSS